MRLPFPAALLAALAMPAAAQPADPIGALLERPAQSQPDPEEPDTAAEPPAPPEPEPQIALPAAPQPYAVRRPQLTSPVFLDETGKTPDAPPTVRDLAYESRLRASFASAQGFQGPLDGAWTLSTSDGAGLYSLKLVDRGTGVVEGAWRDLRRPGAISASGFVDEIRQEGGRLTLRFAGASGTFTGGYGSAWQGQLEEGGRRVQVSLRKAPPQP
jgi:hypothetical protein